MSTIRDGALKVYKTENGQPEEILIAGGFAEVSARGLTVLAERAEG
jgi:F-type H+-transporting ATPase subunit epsilon